MKTVIREIMGHATIEHPCPIYVAELERMTHRISSLVKKYDHQKAECWKYWKENIEGRRVEATQEQNKYLQKMLDSADQHFTDILTAAREISILANGR
jgi:hypothetical protein